MKKNPYTGDPRPDWADHLIKSLVLVVNVADYKRRTRPALLDDVGSVIQDLNDALLDALERLMELSGADPDEPDPDDPDDQPADTTC